MKKKKKVKFLVVALRPFIDSRLEPIFLVLAVVLDFLLGFLALFPVMEA